MSRATHIIIVISLGLLAGCAQESQERAWNVATVEERDIVVAVQAAGIIEPVTTVELKSKASGEILDISAETGEKVESGRLIVQIDKRTPRNALNQAQAELEAAKARRDIAKSQRDRAENLFKTGTLNQVDLEQSVLEFANAKAEVVRAQVAVENARVALDDTEVRTPIAGTVIQRDVEIGQVISSPMMDMGGGTVLLSIADLQYVQVRALVDETDIGKISADQKAKVTVAAYPNQPFNGTVLKIEPSAAEEETVTLFAVIVKIDNVAGLLRPGMNAEVEIDIASRYGVPAIPTIALRTPRDVAAAALFTGIDESVIRDQLREAGMTLPDVVSAASSAAGYEESDTASGDNTDAPTAGGEVNAATDGEPAGTASVAAGDQSYQYGGKYWIFVMQDGVPVARYVRTGLTDLDYSEVVSGLARDDQVLMLPSSDLILSQDRFREMMGQAVGLPGMNSDKDKDKEKGK